MPFPVDEQPVSIARLGLFPIVSTHQGFQQDHSVILQPGLAIYYNEPFSSASTEYFFTTICSP